jgi:SAM-dependent methyltransferase
LAEWYDGWVGKDGSKHHQKLAIPAVLKLLDLQPGEKVLDVGAGQGVLCPHIVNGGGQYVGVEISKRLLASARKHHGAQGQFIEGDALNLPALPGLDSGGFDALIFLLSLQDMDPLEGALESAAWALRAGGRMVLLLTHPCFRVPRQSGWGWDEGRKLRYRRIDRYLTPLPVPLKSYPGKQMGVTTSFHRPLQDYVNGLADCGMVIDRIQEIPTYKEVRGPRAKAENRSNREIPLFLGIRALKILVDK